jgi:parvulin-like peptidyl-prolyl isomerase
MFKVIPSLAALSAFSWLGISAILPAVSVAAPAGQGTSKPKLTPKSVVITVGSTSIQKRQIDTLVNLMIKARAAQGQGEVSAEDRGQIEKMVATNLIGQELLDQEAKKLGIVISDKTIDSAFLTFRGKFPDAKAFDLALKQSGEDEKALKQKLARQLKADRMINAQVGQLAPPDDKEIEAFFNENKKQFPMSDSLRACQILIRAPKEMKADEANRKKAQLEGLRSELLQDTASPFLMLRKFIMAASQVGEGPEKAAGGDLQRFKPSDFHADFSKNLKGLKVGALSPVFRTPLGWHLVILTERNDGKFESYRLAIAQLLMSQRTQKSGQDLRKYLQSLAGKYKVKYMSAQYKDTSPAALYN